MEDISTKINKKKYSNTKYFSRNEFLFKNYIPGNILDLGNLGGVYGEGKSHSFSLDFKKAATQSVLYGFDLYSPKNMGNYPNQKQGDIENELPYEDGFFDTVYMGELIEHLSDLKTALSEIRRVLKKDGVFILDTPNPYSLFRLVKWLLKREENLGDLTHLIFFTPASLQAVLFKHGFTIEIQTEKLSRKFRFLPHFLIKGLGSHLIVLAKKTQ